MKKAGAVVLLAAMMAAVGAVNSNAGTINWIYTGDLGGTYTAGWLVQLVQDVSQNGFGPGGTFGPSTGTGSDDVPVAGVTDVLVNNKAGTYWGSSFTAPGGSLALGAHVYSVIYDAASVGAATHYQIVDAAPFALPAADQNTDYTLSSVANPWQPIPEPGTMALLGLGLVTLASRSIRKKQ